MQKSVICPICGKSYKIYANPSPTADVIIYNEGYGIVLIERLNPPYGFALPGGFIDEGEQAELAAIREMKEETGLDVELKGLLGVYSNPKRDPRQHTLTSVFVGKALDPSILKAGDDAKSAKFYEINNLPKNLAFDHDKILQDFLDFLNGSITIAKVQPH